MKRPCPQEKKVNNSDKGSIINDLKLSWNFLENQDTIKKPNVISGNSTRKNEETYCNKNNKVFLIGDSHLNRINKENFRKKFKRDWVYFKCFPGANTKQLDYYSIPILVDEKPNTTVIHIGSNDITKSNYHSINADEIAKVIVNVGLNYKYYGVGQIAISSILARSNNDLNKVTKQVNVSLRSLCKAYVLLSYVTKILIGIVYGDMVFISQMRVCLYCPKTF